MKRKVKKFNGEDGSRVYDKEDEGLLGGKVKYREEDGRKYVAGRANPMDRNPQEQRYYSVDDVKGGLSKLFGGKKEEEAPKAEGTNRFTATKDNTPDPEKGIASGFKSSEPKFERNDNEVAAPAKKAAPRKAAPAPKEKDAEAVRKAVLEANAPTPKKTKAEEATSSKDVISKPAKEEPKKEATPMKKEEPAKKGFSTNMGKTQADREAQTKANREAVSDLFSGIKLRDPWANDEKAKKPFERRLNTKPTADQMKKMAKGGKVKSASARADGCAIRGKTRA